MLEDNLMGKTYSATRLRLSIGQPEWVQSLRRSYDLPYKLIRGANAQSFLIGILFRFIFAGVGL